MKKLACLAAALMLAACNDTATEAPAAEETVAAPEATPTAASMALDGGPSYGMYKVTSADGTEINVDVKEDGTFSYTGPDGKEVSGTWTEDTPGHYCETVDGTETCYNEEMKDGEWTSTGPDGSVSKVERVTS